MAKSLVIQGHSVRVSGFPVQIARLRDEYYDSVHAPEQFIGALSSPLGRPAHLFTFLQSVPDRTPHYEYHLEWDSAAVLPLTTYEHWWTKQINDKTRNMVRKAEKNGVTIRISNFDDNLVNGIVRIHNETPLRQGRRFRHYGKPFDTVKREHASFLERSEFICAYYRDELIGFIKLVHGDGVSNLMQIISLVSYRDKAPNNALIAKAVERCTVRNIPMLHYGTWSRRNMGDFKKHHAFQRMLIPRYYAPLTTLGWAALRCGLHRNLRDTLPESWLDRMALWRSKWNAYRYRSSTFSGAVAQLAERRS